MFDVSTVVLSDVDINIYNEIKSKAVEFHKQYVDAVSKTDPKQYKLNMNTRLYLFIKTLETRYNIEIWKSVKWIRRGF